MSTLLVKSSIFLVLVLVLPFQYMFNDWCYPHSLNPSTLASHLPDMTVITPVFMEGRRDGIGPAFFVAARGHHADVGGIAPGSMPPLSKTLEEVRIGTGQWGHLHHENTVYQVRIS